MDASSYLADLVESRPSGIGPENLVILRTAGSTNQVARGIVAEYEKEEQDLHPLLILALEQSGGRGRQGRGWTSPLGQGVYATRVLRVEDPEVLQTLPLLAGVGLCRGLAPHLPFPCRLKWPNDLIVETPQGRRKIGGVLIEALIRPEEGAAAILGFGVNLGHGADDLPEGATSLSLLGRGETALGRLTWDLVDGLERELARLGDVAYAVESYRELSVHQAGERLVCRMGESVVEGSFAGFDERGRLLLDRDGEELRLAAGEVIES